jgi:predicted O-linked N-acetylglucosamine transferase (SPINDLY family)
VPVNAATAYESAFAAHRSGDLEAAVAGYERALALDAQHAAALHMLGVARLQQGQASDAVELIVRSLGIAEDAAAYSNLTSALTRLGRLDEAIEAGRRATAVNPDSADAWGNLGTAYARGKRDRDAATAFERAVAIAPGRAGLHSALGVALGKLGRFEEALTRHREAIELAPDRPQYRNNMSITLQGAGLSREAEEVLRSAIADSNADPDMLVSLGSMLRRRGDVTGAVAAWRQANDAAGNRQLGMRLSLLSNYLDETSVEDLIAQARRNAEAMTTGVERLPPASPDMDRDRPIRVGFVSPDLRNHAVACFLRTVMPALDQRQLALYAYSGRDNGDSSNLLFRRTIPNWRSTVEMTAREIAEAVRRDEIDILVDLSGPTRGSRIASFAYKPAPIAVTWLGYSGTTGLDAVDYILGDREVLPEGLVQTTEEPWRLPDAYLCFAPPLEAPAVSETPALSNGFVTFGSFNNVRKLSEATLDAWSRILHEVPNSRLHLKANERDSGDDTRLREALAGRGIDATRLTVLPWIEGWGEHLQHYSGFDIGLDSFPYNGTTTTCEALYMGVPVLTLRGDRFIARVGATLLHNAGLDDWIAESVDGYVARAVEAASGIPALAALRSGLRQRFLATPVCDAPRFARNLEAAFRGMWHRYCDGRSSS